MAVDVGGTKIRSASVDGTGRLGPVHDQPTPDSSDHAVMSAIGDAVARCLPHHPGQLPVVGFAFPGVVDLGTGRLRRCQNLPDLDAHPLAEVLANRLDAETLIDNDVNLAAIGETWRTDGPTVDDMVVLSLGTGIGAGIISGGRLLRGHQGLAAEIADLPLFGDPHDPALAAQGIFESAVGSVGILRSYHDRGGAVTVRTVAEVVARADRDAFAAQTLDELAERVAVSVMVLRAIVDPEVVVLTGGIGSAPPVRQRIQAAVAALPYPPLPVVGSVLGDKAALVGAAALACGRVGPWVSATPSARPRSQPASRRR